MLGAFDKPIDGTPVSIPQFVVGVMGCIWVPIVLYRAWRSSRQNAAEREGVYTAILPCYLWLLAIAAVITIVQSIVNMMVPNNLVDEGVSDATVLGVTWGMHRMPLEGLTFFLLQRGAGYRSMRRAIWAGFAFGVGNCLLFVPAFRHIHEWGIFVITAWNAAMAAGYAVLWLTPLRWLYRRPALVMYSAYWAILRTLVTVSFVLDYEQYSDAASIVYFLSKGVMFSIMTPRVLYATLVTDSQFWQGLHTAGRPMLRQLIAPLEGIRYSAASAAELVGKLDDMATRSRVVMLNFAALKLDTHLLGVGGQARVYRGYYRDQQVAVKVVFCIELTQEVVNDFCNEAMLLTRLQHPNIVKTFGVCVVPPTVSIVMELCAHGSLGDVLHSEKQMQLSWHKKLALCRDCASAITFLHSKGAVHKDIKSGNFLVSAASNGDLIAKLADLGVAEDYLKSSLGNPGTPQSTQPDAKVIELASLHSSTSTDDHTQTTVGISTGGSSSTGGFRGTLAWAAPEVLLGFRYTPAADVYSLALVLWEVLSNQYPFSTRWTAALTAEQLCAAIAGQGSWQKYQGPSQREASVSETAGGLRPPLPLNTPEAFSQLLQRGWSAKPELRPSAAEVLQQLDDMLRSAPRSTTEDVHQPRWHMDAGIDLSDSHRPKRASSRGSLRSSIVSTLNPLMGV